MDRWDHRLAEGQVGWVQSPTDRISDSSRWPAHCWSVLAQVCPWSLFKSSVQCILQRQAWLLHEMAPTWYMRALGIQHAKPHGIIYS